VDGKFCGDSLEPAGVYCSQKVTSGGACDCARRTFCNATPLVALVLFLFAAARPGWSVCTPPKEIAKRLTATPDAAVYADLGTLYADRKQFGCAADVFRKAAALQPESARYHYLLGLSLYSAGHAEEAIDPLQQSLQLDPTFAEAHMTMGAALDQTGNRTAAETQWRQALAGNPNSAVALENLSRDLLADRNYAAAIALLHPMEKTLTDESAVNLSVAYSKSGLLQDAADLLQKKLQSDPASLSLAEALSSVLILQSRFQEAIQVLSPIAKQHPTDAKAQSLFLQTLVLGHDPGAEAVAKHLLASDPHQWEVLYFLGVLRQQAGDDVSARDDFNRSIALNPDYADTHHRLGLVLLELKDSSAAEEQLRKAIALGDDAPEVHVALARALRSLGDSEAAQQQFQLYQQQLQVQAARAQAANKAQQGDQAEAAGNPQQTVEDYRDALALDPQEPVLAYKLAMALDKTGDRSGERAALEKTIALDPHMALAQNQLGYLDSGEGNTEAAIRHFRLAVQVDEGFTGAWLNLAASFSLESKWPEARSALSHVLEVDSSNVNARALLQRIDAMQAQR
jgi:Flp pilus assembly protein TadD